MQEFEWKNKPRPGDEGDVDEPDDVPQQPHHQNLHVPVLGDDLEAVEVGAHLRDVVDDGGNTKDGRVTAVVLEMPEEEGEDQADADAHHPGGQGEGEQSQVGQRLHDGTKLRH